MPNGLERPPGLPAPVAHHTGFVLYKVAHFLQEALDHALEPWGLRTRHYTVLAMLANLGSMSQQAIGRKSRIDRATMVKVVDDLERLGLVERRRNADDRRFYDLTLTAEGLAQLAAAEEAVEEMEAIALSPLSAEQQGQLHGLLSSLLGPVAGRTE